MWFNIFQKVGIFKCICQIIIKGNSNVDTPFHKKKTIKCDWIFLHIEESISWGDYPTLHRLKVQCFYCCSIFHSHCRVFYNEHDSTYIITNA
jgi:hypothetical protein